MASICRASVRNMCLSPSPRFRGSTIQLVFLGIILFSNAAFGQFTGACQRPVLSLYKGVQNTTGRINATLILVDFPDAAANESAKDLLTALPLAGISDFMKESSFGQLDLHIVPYAEKYYRMPSESSDYGYNLTNITESLYKYATDVLKVSAGNGSFGDSQFLFIMPARQQYFTASPSSFGRTGGISVLAPGGHTFSGVLVFGSEFVQALSTSRAVPVAASSLGYLLGLRPPCPAANVGDSALGGFSSFCTPFPLVPDYFAQQKWSLGWLDELKQVTCLASEQSGPTTINRTITLSGVEVDEKNSSTVQPKLAIMALPGGLTLYAEARTQKGLDKDACLAGAGAGGVLLYAGQASSSNTQTNSIVILNPQANNSAAPAQCANGLKGYLAPLGLSRQYQLNNYTIPDAQIRVTVLSQDEDAGTFQVRFEAPVGTGVSNSSSTTPTAPAQASATTSSAAVRCMSIHAGLDLMLLLAPAMFFVGVASFG